MVMEYKEHEKNVMMEIMKMEMDVVATVRSLEYVEMES